MLSINSLSKYCTQPVKCLGVLVVVHSSNSARPCSQDVRLSVSPDFPDDPLPFLQSLCPLQLLGWGEHVPAQCPVRRDEKVAHGDLCGAVPDGGVQASCIFLLLIIALLVFLLLLTIVFQLFFLRHGGRRSGPRLAGNPDDQEAESEHQAKTDADDKVKAQTLWIGWIDRETSLVYNMFAVLLTWVEC